MSAILDLNQVGTYKSSIKIAKTPEIGEARKPVFLDIEGQQKKLKFWPDQKEKFLLPLDAGTEGEAEIEVKSRVDNNGDTVIEAWLKSFGGSKPKYGGGGGGGRQFTPKTPEEIHSASICGIVKSCIEFSEAGNFDEFCDQAVAAYMRGMSKVCGSSPKAEAVTASPQQAVVTHSPMEDEQSPPDPYAVYKAEATAYWRETGGTKGQFQALLVVAEKGDKETWQWILEGKATGQSPTEIIRLATPKGHPEGSGVAEPGDIRNSTRSETSSATSPNGTDEDYENWSYEMINALALPGLSLPKEFIPWQLVFRQQFGWEYASAAQIEREDWKRIYDFLGLVSTEQEPFPKPFKVWKDEQNRAQKREQRSA